MSFALAYNPCSTCAHKEYTQTLCSECADRFCLSTCGAIFAYDDHQEPSVCPKCHKIHAYAYFETSFGIPANQVSA